MGGSSEPSKVLLVVLVAFLAGNEAFSPEFLVFSYLALFEEANSAVLLKGVIGCGYAHTACPDDNEVEFLAHLRI